MNRRVAALLGAFPFTALTVSSCGAPDKQLDGWSRSLAELRECAARSSAIQRETEDCPSLENIGHRAPEPAAPRDHTPLAWNTPERIARDAALRKTMKERLPALKFEAHFTDAGYLGWLTILDRCVAPAAQKTSSSALDLDDLKLMEGILRDNADLLGLLPFAKLEMACGDDNYHYPSDGPPRSPFNKCKVHLSPTPLIEPVIVVEREGAPVPPESCVPKLKLSSSAYPLTADMIPKPTVDVDLLVKKHIGEELTIPGRPAQKVCSPIEPWKGDRGDQRCVESVPIPDRKVTVTRENQSVSELWAVYWDAPTSTYRVYRQLVIELPTGAQETHWITAAPPKDLARTVAFHRPWPPAKPSTQAAP